MYETLDKMLVRYGLIKSKKWWWLDNTDL